MHLRRAVFSLILIFSAIVSRADTWTNKDVIYTYRLAQGKATLYKEYASAAIPVTTAGALVVPSALDGHPLVAIGASAFDGCKRLTSVTLPAGITSIGGDAFSGCSALASVTIPAGVKSIGMGAFRGCRALTVAALPSGLDIIGDEAFRLCASLESVTLPEGLTYIGASAFAGCSRLAPVKIPPSVFYVGAKAFHGTAFYKKASDGPFCVDGWFCGYNGQAPAGSLVLPPATRGIAVGAFADGCSHVNSVTIPAGVTAISDGRGLFEHTAFYRDVPDGPLCVDGWFCGYKGEAPVGELVLPPAVRRIAVNAFFNCRRTTSVTVPAGVEFIGSSAFAFANSLKSVRYLGNAPAVGKEIYGPAWATPTNYVSAASTGWDGRVGSAAKPSTWQGRPLVVTP